VCKQAFVLSCGLGRSTWLLIPTHHHKISEEIHIYNENFFIKAKGRFHNYSTLVLLSKAIHYSLIFLIFHIQHQYNSTVRELSNEPFRAFMILKKSRNLINESFYKSSTIIYIWSHPITSYCFVSIRTYMHTTRNKFVIKVGGCC
jgi:hypothetical protein